MFDAGAMDSGHKMDVIEWQNSPAPKSWIPLAKQIVQLAVEHCATELREQMSAFGGPTHRLKLNHSLLDYMTHSGFRRCTGDS